MNRIKFCSFFEDGTSVEDVIICPHYEVYKRPNQRTTITTFKGMTNVDGVERHVGVDEEYQVCYIENENGKTVAVHK